MNTKKNSLIPGLFEFAGSYRSLIVLSWVLSGLSSVLSIGPFICIWFVIRDIFRAMPDVTQATEAAKFGWMAVAFAVASIVLYFVALLCSHLAAFRVEKNMRKAAMHQIVKLSLGVENETKIQTALTELIKNKTVLIIAHRMRTVANADRIIVLSDGYVSQKGKPEDLIKQDGLYRHMVEIQTQSMDWAL